jgi:hypothetical protein
MIHFLNHATVITDEQFAIMRGNGVICQAVNDQLLMSQRPIRTIQTEWCGS